VPRTDDSTAYAANWRTVLAVDAGLGALVALVGVVLALSVNAAAGAVLGALGAGYAALVGVRARRWSRLRGGASR
jgi:hypothetical protein